MKCPDCGWQLDYVPKFCTNCGKKFPEILKGHINQAIKSSVQEQSVPLAQNNLSITSQNQDLQKYETKESKEIISETNDIKIIQYKKLVEEVFSDGIVTADEIILLSNKIKELGLDKNEALIIQEDVAKELNFNIDEEGDLISNSII